MAGAEGILGPKVHAERPGTTGGTFVGNVKERYFGYVLETSAVVSTKN